MTYNQLQKEFEELGYSLEYRTGTEGRGYYVRPYGTTEHKYFENSRAAIENRLELLQERYRG